MNNVISEGGITIKISIGTKLQATKECTHGTKGHILTVSSFDNLNSMLWCHTFPGDGITCYTDDELINLKAKYPHGNFGVYHHQILDGTYKIKENTWDE